MQVVLLRDVASVGKKGEIVSISDGYARNFLLPRKFAEPATSAHAREFHTRVQAKADHRTVEKEELKQRIAALAEKTILFKLPANEQGHLFKGVRKEDVAQAVRAQHGVAVDTSHVELTHPLKEAGIHHVKISANGSSALISVDISPTS